MNEAKEKAKELIEKFGLLLTFNLAKTSMSDEEYVEGIIPLARQSASMAVDEIMKVCPYINSEKRGDVERVRAPLSYFTSYWQQVKTEIENYKL